jgi:hypothetical protein
LPLTPIRLSPSYFEKALEQRLRGIEFGWEMIYNESNKAVEVTALFVVFHDLLHTRPPTRYASGIIMAYSARNAGVASSATLRLRSMSTRSAQREGLAMTCLE